ncbi:MAG: hypothetical protein AVDCRST_MAG68-5358, partial [uncultured Gemmatimonadetes bacterium]
VQRTHLHRRARLPGALDPRLVHRRPRHRPSLRGGDRAAARRGGRAERAGAADERRAAVPDAAPFRGRARPPAGASPRPAQRGNGL